MPDTAKPLMLSNTRLANARIASPTSGGCGAVSMRSSYQMCLRRGDGSARCGTRNRSVSKPDLAHRSPRRRPVRKTHIAIGLVLITLKHQEHQEESDLSVRACASLLGALGVLGGGMPRPGLASNEVSFPSRR